MPAPGAALFNSLSDDLLRLIISLLPQEDRVRTLPLVCNRWHNIMADASMWPALDLAPWEYCRTQEQFSSVNRWLRKRSSGLRELTIQTRGTDTRLHLPAALLSLAPTATQLQQLRIVTEDIQDANPFNAHALADVSRLHSLTRLDAAYITSPPDLPALDALLAHLPALQAVQLHFCPGDRRLLSGTDTDSDDDGVGNHADYSPRETGFPHSLLRCTGLTSLDLSVFEPNDVDAMYAMGRIPWDITALQRLQCLRLDDCVTAPLPRSISQMTQLTSLRILQKYFNDNRQLFQDSSGRVALPVSLQALQATSAPLWLLAPLMGLQHLSLEYGIRNVRTTVCSLSTLQRLTSLHMSFPEDAALLALAGCTGLRELRLTAPATTAVAPLPYQQLTRLQLRGSFEVADVQTMVSELPRLEVLEVLETDQAFELLAFDAAVLSRLPKLRLVKLSASLWDHQSMRMPLSGDAAREDLPLPMAQKLMSLQRANPNIEWHVGVPWRRQ